MASVYCFEIADATHRRGEMAEDANSRTKPQQCRINRTYLIFKKKHVLDSLCILEKSLFKSLLKMPQLPPYQYTGPVDCTIPPNRAVLKGKSVIVTGGMSPSLFCIVARNIFHLTIYRSEWYGGRDGSRFCSGRVFRPLKAWSSTKLIIQIQCICHDSRSKWRKREGGHKRIESVSLSTGLLFLAFQANSNVSNAQFVKCNITSWDDQVAMFEAAIENSPHKSCDIVIANAGISRASGDDLWPLDGNIYWCLQWPSNTHWLYTDPDLPPVKPELNIVNVNLIGTMYTWKLAVHYFRKQPDTQDRDRCFIITGSMVSWIDSPVRAH